MSIDINSAVKLIATTSKSNIFYFLPTSDLNSNSQFKDLISSKTRK
ncbi:MAG: hypothetical protein ACI87N_002130 [Flavobacteriales bacterium]